MKKLIYIIIASTLALAACEKTLDFPFEYKQPKLVLNCVLSNTSEIDFSVSRSMHILDSKEIVMISDADVIIFEDDKPLQVVPVSDGQGNYHAAYVPKAGHTYKFQVSKDGFETIEAEATIVAPTKINSFTGKTKATEEGEYYYSMSEMDFSLDFSDDQQQENYYLITLTSDVPKEMKDYLNSYYSQSYYSYDLLDSTYQLNIECNDVSVSSSYGGTAIYLSDEIISGGNYTIKFKANDYRGLYGIFDELQYWGELEEDEEEEEDSEDNNDVEDLPFYREFEYSVVVHLQAISKDYYQYQKSYDLYIENDGNPFAEPTLVKTNVKNGLGLLAASSEVTDTIRFTIKNPYLEEELEEEEE